MKKFLLLVIFTFSVVLSSCNFATAQQVGRLSGRCQSPYRAIYQSIEAVAAGDLVYTPCPTRSSIFTGNVDFSGATVTGLISGSGTAGYVPVFQSDTSIIASPLEYSSGVYNFLDNNFTNNYGRIDTTSRTVNFGDINSAGNGNRFVIDDTANQFIMQRGANQHFLIDTSALEYYFGDIYGTGNGTSLVIEDTNSSFSFTGTNGRFDLQAIAQFNVNKENTATVGNVVMDKPFGEVIMDLGASALVVSNAYIFTANALVFVTGQTDDAGCNSFHVGNKGVGAFEIISNAPCVADTKIAFWVVN